MASPPNFVRDFTSDPANNSTFGTLDLRLTFTNGTGASLTRLRFRVIDLTTFPAPSNFSDLRPRTSTDVVVTVDRPPCGSGTSNVTVHGTTLEQPPSQPNGGGFNSTWSVPAVSSGAPLADGASLDVRFLLGIQQTGCYKVALVAEGEGAGGGTSQVVYRSGGTDAACALAGPAVSSITRAGADPTNASSVQFTVTFSEAVTGVDASDFALTTTGVSGASVTGVSGSGTTYTVTVGTGSGSGTIRLDAVDDDTIVNAGSTPLGGAGAGNGNFSAGQAYTIDKTPPTVTINQGAAQSDPTATPPIVFDVVFSKPVSGFVASDVNVGGTAGATTATVSGSGTTYTVSVSGMTANGVVTASIGAGAAVDAVGNASAASTSTDNSVTFSGIAVTQFTGPTGTGTGTATASFTGGGVSCTFQNPQFIGAPPGASPIPPVGVADVTFPQGLFTFSTTGCTPGAAMTFTVVFPGILPAGTQYWKYGPTPGQPAPHWYVLPATIAGNTVTFTIIDGGLGDDDLAANGSIVDQGGPGITAIALPATPVPTLGPWALAAMAILLAAGAAVATRRMR